MSFIQCRNHFRIGNDEAIDDQIRDELAHQLFSIVDRKSTLLFDNVPPRVSSDESCVIAPCSISGNNRSTGKFHMQLRDFNRGYRGYTQSVGWRKILTVEKTAKN